MSSNSPTNLAERYAFLQGELARLEHAYYVLDNPLLPDSEYDLLYRELLDIEAAHPPMDYFRVTVAKGGRYRPERI